MRGWTPLLNTCVHRLSRIRCSVTWETSGNNLLFMQLYSITESVQQLHVCAWVERRVSYLFLCLPKLQYQYIWRGWKFKLRALLGFSTLVHLYNTIRVAMSHRPLKGTSKPSAPRLTRNNCDQMPTPHSLSDNSVKSEHRHMIYIFLHPLHFLT